VWLVVSAIVIMKYGQFILGIIVGLILAYGGSRIVHHLQRTGSVLPSGVEMSQPAQADTKKKGENELNFSHVSFAASAKLGQVTFTYDLVPSNASDNAIMQLFVNVDGVWEQFTPKDDNGTIVFHLYKDLDCTGTFKIDLPKGTYSQYRMILFDAPDGTNADFDHVLWDSVNQKNPPVPSVNFAVTSDAAPIDAPVITYPPNPLESSQGGGLSTVTIPAIVKYPADYAPDGGGFWAMAKGNGGFSQVWVDPKNAIQNGGEGDSVNSIPIQIPIQFVLKNLRPGIYNVQFGLFKPSFGNPLQWIYPGLDFEAGGDSWETKAPQDHIPPRLHVEGNHFLLTSGKPFNFYSSNTSGRLAATFVRGGNYGNAITWTAQPALDTPGYFTLLADMGCHYIRFNFDPDRYIQQRMYANAVDQVVQNIWMAGLYPIIAPQDLPSGSSLQQRIDKGNKLLAMVAAKYSGKSVWIEICNEPHEFATWSQWKPVAERYVRTIRTIDPGAFVIVPFENYSADGVGAAKSPITDIHVDLYDGHAYIDATKVAAAFAPAIKAGLPVIIGEYGGNDPTYLHHMDRTFQSLSPEPLAISPWAFTIKGQDSLPLVLNGSTANLVLTPAGQAVSKDFRSWDDGRKLQ
jgi:hypothetical protein